MSIFKGIVSEVVWPIVSNEPMCPTHYVWLTILYWLFPSEKPCPTYFVQQTINWNILSVQPHLPIDYPYLSGGLARPTTCSNWLPLFIRWPCPSNLFFQLTTLIYWNILSVQPLLPIDYPYLSGGLVRPTTSSNWLLLFIRWPCPSNHFFQLATLIYQVASHSYSWLTT